MEDADDVDDADGVVAAVTRRVGGDAGRPNDDVDVDDDNDVRVLPLELTLGRKDDTAAAPEITDAAPWEEEAGGGGGGDARGAWWLDATPAVAFGLANGRIGVRR